MPTFMPSLFVLQVGTDSEKPPGDDENAESSPKLLNFLRRVVPLVEEELDQNFASRAFDGYHVSMQSSAPACQLWSSMSVDLEKNKVLYTFAD
jgi:hypothetical protein